jgi:sugar phosphate permease
MILGLVQQMDAVTLPFIGEIRSWQIVLLVVGGLSLLMVIPLSWMPEPKRQGKQTVEKKELSYKDAPQDEFEYKGDAQKNLSFKGVLHYLWNHKAFYGVFIVAFTTANVAGYGVATWIPSYFIRVHEWDSATTGITVGALYIVPAIIGGLISGWLADFLFGKGYRAAPLYIMFTALLIIGPLIFIFIYAPVMQLKIPALVTFYLVETMSSILFPTAILMATPHFIRAQVSALNLLVVNLVGIGFGPMTIALVTDYVFKDEMAVGHSIAIVGVLAYGIGACILFFAIKPIRQRVITVIAEGEHKQSHQDKGLDVNLQNKALA